MTAYTAPSGAVVFAAGSRQLVWGLADGSSLAVMGGGLVDPRLQRFIGNMLDDLSTPRSADLSIALTPDPAPSPVWGRKVDAVIANAGPDTVRRANLDITLPRGHVRPRCLKGIVVHDPPSPLRPKRACSRLQRRRRLHRPDEVLKDDDQRARVRARSHRS